MDENNNIGWFVAGAVIGAAVALLYAPKSGSDTRKYLEKTTHDGREAMEASGRELMDRGKELYERGQPDRRRRGRFVRTRPQAGAGLIGLYRNRRFSHYACARRLVLVGWRGDVRRGAEDALVEAPVRRRVESDRSRLQLLRHRERPAAHPDRDGRRCPSRRHGRSNECASPTAGADLGESLAQRGFEPESISLSSSIRICTGTTRAATRWTKDGHVVPAFPSADILLHARRAGCMRANSIHAMR